MPISVLIAGSHPLFCDALAIALRSPRLDILAECPRTGPEAIEAAVRTRPDIALIDYLIRDPDGPGVCRAIKERVPTTKVILLSGLEGVVQRHKAHRAGAAAVLPKDLSVAELIDVIVRADMGQDPVYKPAEPQRLRGLDNAEQARIEEGLAKLTPREREILHLMAEGMVPEEITATLGIKLLTLRRHVYNIMRKTQARTSMEAVLMAREEGMVQ